MAFNSPDSSSMWESSKNLHDDSDPEAFLRELDRSKVDRIKTRWSRCLSLRVPLNVSDATSPSDDALDNFLRREIRSLLHATFPVRVIHMQGTRRALKTRSEVTEYIIRDKIKKNPEIYQKMKDSFVNWSRALERHETGDYSVPIFETVKEVTRFAFLSHIWGRKDLSCYESLREELDITTSPGYEQFREFCRVAQDDHGVEFAWADSACLNLNNALELDETLRSLFTWCHESSVCIIYLAETNTLYDFPFDQWFTRVWTVQELLAPRKIKFYNKSWKAVTSLLNDKPDPRVDDEKHPLQTELLRDGISKATNINFDHIHGFKPGLWNPPFPERMRWIAHRKTTRLEDMAYSMMGVLGVTIPIAYGEGPERAFYRLFQAVLKVDWSPSWFLWGGKPISRSIHPSRMIPSSPTCYLFWNLECDPFGNLPRAPQWDRRNMRKRVAIALTNTGLPIELLVVPAKVTPIDSQRPADANITCPISDETVTMIVEHDRNVRTNFRGQFALGILDYDFAPESARSRPRHVYAILLHRYHGRDKPEDRVWRCGEWGRLETGKIIRFELKEEFRTMKVEDWTKVEIHRSDVGWEVEDIVCNAQIEFRSLHL